MWDFYRTNYMNDVPLLYGLSYVLSDYSCGWNTYHYDYINTFNSYVCCHVYYQTTPPAETLTTLITKMIFYLCGLSCVLSADPSLLNI